MFLIISQVEQLLLFPLEEPYLSSGNSSKFFDPIDLLHKEQTGFKFWSVLEPPLLTAIMCPHSKCFESISLLQQ